MRTVRAVMLGDVVGDPGLEALERLLPSLIREHSVDFVMVNGENAAGGFGLTLPHLERIFAAGADVVSGGNHIFEKREFWPALDSDAPIIRPMNYSKGSPGRGWIKLAKPPVTWLALNLQGREFMSAIDCPFRAFDTLEQELKNSADGLAAEKTIVLVDFHAESSREKEALAYYLDGRVSVIAGTHTHVQTADERILPKGTAYITDLGMCGALDGVIGMDTRICLDRARSQVLYRMEVAVPAAGDRTAIQGIMLEFDGDDGRVLSIKRV